MKESKYRSYNDLPLFFNAKMVAEALGIAAASGYELLHQDGFPSLRIGSRLVVPKEKFIRWVDEQTGGDN